MHHSGLDGWKQEHWTKKLIMSSKHKEFSNMSRNQCDVPSIWNLRDRWMLGFQTWMNRTVEVHLVDKLETSGTLLMSHGRARTPVYPRTRCRSYSDKNRLIYILAVYGSHKRSIHSNIHLSLMFSFICYHFIIYISRLKLD